MCDRDSFLSLRARVETLERDHIKHVTAAETQIKMLLTAIKWLFGITCVFCLILLLTVVYGAIGERGFRHVTHASGELAKELTPSP